MFLFTVMDAFLWQIVLSESIVIDFMERSLGTLEYSNNLTL